MKRAGFFFCECNGQFLFYLMPTFLISQHGRQMELTVTNSKIISVCDS